MSGLMGNEVETAFFRIRILLVDDSDYDQTAFRRWLNAVPDLYMVKGYESAEDVLEDEELKLEEFDLLVIDNYLPGLSGLQLGKILRSRGAIGSMILMTGSGSQQLVIDALTGGFDDYVIKDLEGSYLKMLPTILANNYQRYRDKKAAQESQKLLAANEAKYRGFFENTTDLMFSVDENGRFVFVNKAWVESLAFAEERKDRYGILDVIHPEDKASFQELFEKAKRGESQQDVEARFVSLTGRVIDALGSVVCRMEGGVPCGVRGIFMDISARKAMENEMARLNEALEEKVEERTRSLSEKVEELKLESERRERVAARLQESEDRIRTIVEHAPEAILVLDVEKNCFIDCNARARSLFKMSREELLRSSPSSHVPNDVAVPHDDIRKEMISKAVAGELVSFTTRRMDAEGRLFPCEIRMVRLPSKEQVLVRSSIIDISERERVESERSRMMVAIEQLEEIVVVTDLDGRVQYVNPAFGKTTGYSDEEITGKVFSMHRGSGDSGEDEKAWKTLKKGRSWRGQFMSGKRDGTLFSVEASFTPVKNAAGEIVNFVGILRDVTEQIELERRLGIAQRMESIGTLAGGIAHDFNNILAGIIGYTDLALGSVSPEGEVHEFLLEIGNASDRAKTLVAQILECGRQGNAERKAIELHSIVKEALELLRKAIPATIAIESRINSDCRKVYADPTRIHQVVMNLCTNAYHAVQETEGVIEVTLEEVEVGPEMAHVENLEAGPYVCLRVRDNGYGMDETTMARIFDPYFTTKEVGEGTGLGLATVLGIVQKHGGTIIVQSKPREGAVFEVLLPAIEGCEDEFDADESKKNAIAQVGLGERVMLVDDDTALLSASRRSLERIGYNISVYSNAPEALEAFRSSPQYFDLVITDYAMPKMNGMTLSASLLEIREDIPIILCSGYSDKIREKQARDAGLQAYMMKPVSAVILANKIRNILDERSGAPELS